MLIVCCCFYKTEMNTFCASCGDCMRAPNGVTGELAIVIILNGEAISAPKLVSSVWWWYDTGLPIAETSIHKCISCILNTSQVHLCLVCVYASYFTFTIHALFFSCENTCKYLPIQTNERCNKI